MGKKMKKQKGMPLWLLILLCAVGVLGAGFYELRAYYKEKFAGSAAAYSRQQIRGLGEGSRDYKIARWFYSDDEIASIRDNTVKVDESQDTSVLAEDADGIEIVPVYGSTYEGYLMLIRNAEDLSVAVNPYLSSGQAAPDLDTYVSMYNAAGGTNAGGFQDAGGMGNGSIPQGIVIHNGKLVYGNGDTYMDLIGITEDHHLLCTQATGNEFLSWGVKEAVTFGPTLINNYKVAWNGGADSLNILNPRTAIAQSGDGTFMLLVVDGRGPSSFGAKYEDVIQIFQAHDAVMAANLDGGNSTAMIWKGKYVNTPVSMYGSRNLPTVFLVKGDN